MLYSTPFITMAFANLCTVASFGTFYLFPLFIISRGGSESDIGIIMGAFALSAVLCRPWVSEMIDRIGRKRSYTVGCAILAILPLTYLLFHGDLSQFYVPLIIVRILHGIGLAICFTTAFTYIADIVPKGRLNEGIGMFGVTGLTGLALGPALGEIIIRNYGFSLFFLTASGMAILGFMLHLKLPESFAGEHDELSQSFFSVFRFRRITIVVLLAFLFGIALAASSSFVSPFAKEQDVAFISLYFIAYSSAAVITRLLGGRLADRIGEYRIIPFALVLTGGGLFALTLLGGNMLLIFSGIMSGCGHGFLFPSLNSLAVRHVRIAMRGKITGAFTGGIDAGAFAGSITLGYIGEWAGYRALFATAGAGLLLGLGICRRGLAKEGLPTASGIAETEGAAGEERKTRTYLLHDLKKGG
jgi:MFS family permease